MRKILLTHKCLIGIDAQTFSSAKIFTCTVYVKGRKQVTAGFCSKIIGSRGTIQMKNYSLCAAKVHLRPF